MWVAPEKWLSVGLHFLHMSKQDAPENSSIVVRSPASSLARQTNIVVMYDNLHHNKMINYSFLLENKWVGNKLLWHLSNSDQNVNDWPIDPQDPNYIVFVMPKIMHLHTIRTGLTKNSKRTYEYIMRIICSLPWTTPQPETSENATASTTLEIVPTRPGLGLIRWFGCRIPFQTGIQTGTQTGICQIYTWENNKHFTSTSNLTIAREMPTIS